MALRDLWKGSKARSQPVSPTLASALRDLERLMAERPELDSAGTSLARVLEAAFLGPIAEPSLHAEPELIEAGWRAGVPAFRSGDSPPRIDDADLRVRALALCEALRDVNPQAAAVHQAILAGELDLATLTFEALADHPGSLNVEASSIGADPALLRSILRLTLLPPLSRLAERLAAIRPEGVWERGDCPNCGNAPVLAESRGLEQLRRLAVVD